MILLSAAAGALAVHGQLWAGTQSWNPLGATTAASGGDGNWSTSVNNWWESSSLTAQSWAGDIAAFSGTRGTVTLTTPVTANQLTFGTTGYRITGDTTNTLTLSGGASVSVGSEYVFLDVPLVSSVGMTKTGGGGLVLMRPASAFSGTFTKAASGGRLVIAAAGALGGSGNTISHNTSTGASAPIIMGDIAYTDAPALNIYSSLVNLSGANTYDGVITPSTHTTLTVGHGSLTLTKNWAGSAGNLTKTGAGSFYINSSATAGAFFFNKGSTVVGGADGYLVNNTTVNDGARLTFDYNGAVGARINDRFASGAGISIDRGGIVRFQGSETADSSEVTGNYTYHSYGITEIQPGQNHKFYISVSPYRQDAGATMLIRGPALGSTGAYASLIAATNTGYAPDAAGGTGNRTTNYSVVQTLIADTTIDGNGSTFFRRATINGTANMLVPLDTSTNYVQSLTAANADGNDNARLTASETVSAGTAVSALLLSNSSAINITGSALTIKASSLLSAGAGATVGVPLTFGTTDINKAEGIVYVTGSGALSLNGAVTIVASTTRTTPGFTKSGFGTLSLGSANTIPGQVIVQAGTLQITADGALGDTTGTTAVQTGATLMFKDVAYGNESIAAGTTGFGTIAAQGISSLSGSISGAPTVSASGTSDQLTLSGTLTTSNTVTKTGAGKVIFTATSTGYTGALTINGGTVEISGGGSFASSGAYTANLGTTLALNDTGGVSTVTGGRLKDTSGITLNSAAFRYDGNSTADSTELGGTLTLTGYSTIDVNRAGTRTAEMKFGTAAPTRNGVGNATVLARGINLGSATGTAANTSRILFGASPTVVGTTAGSSYTTTSKTMRVASYVIGDDAGGDGNTFVAYDTTKGVIPLGTDNYYATIAAATGSDGNVRITTGESVGSSKTINALVSSPSVTALINGAGKLSMANGIIATGSANTTFSANVRFVNEGIAHVSSGRTLNLNGTVDAVSGLTKSGLGTLVISGNNTYNSAASTGITGTTTVNAGTLVLSNTTGVAVGPGTMYVLQGATLAGNGSTDAFISVSSGGIIAPGLSAGTLTGNNGLTMVSGGTLNMELASDSSYDRLAINGTVNLENDFAGGAVLNVSLGYVPSATTPLFVVVNDGTDPVMGRFAGLDDGAYVNLTSTADNQVYRFQINYAANSAGGGAGNDIALTYAPVPEPAGLGLVAAGGLGLLGRRRRRV